MLAGAALSFFALIHAYLVNSSRIVNNLAILAAPESFASYAAAALFLCGLSFLQSAGAFANELSASQRVKSLRLQLVSHSTSTMACFGTINSTASAPTFTG